MSMTTQKTERELFREMLVEKYHVPDDDECFAGDSEIDDNFAFWEECRAPLLSRIAELEQLVGDYKEMHESHKSLVRQLDVALNGEEGAAKQASLCDVVAQVKHGKWKLVEQSRIDALSKDAERLDWLARYSVKIVNSSESGRVSVTWYEMNTSGSTAFYPTVREAIDAAISAREGA